MQKAPIVALLHIYDRGLFCVDKSDNRAAIGGLSRSAVAPGAATLSSDTMCMTHSDSGQWSDYKRLAGTVSAAFRSTDHPKLQAWAKRIHECAQHLSYAYQPNIDGGYTRELASAQLCRVRTCPVCQWRRSLRLAAEVGQVLQAMCAPGQGRVALMLTLTVRNIDVSNLRASIQHQLRAWSKLTRRAIFANVYAWARSVEVTRGRQWVMWDSHPHIHALLIVPTEHADSMLETRRWRREWRDLLGVDYEPQCDIRPISDPTTGAGPREVLKYAVKPSHEHAASGWLGRVAVAIDGLRLFAASKTVRISDVLPEDAAADETKHQVDDIPPVYPRPAGRQPVIYSYAWAGRRSEYLRTSVQWGMTAAQWREALRIAKHGPYAHEMALARARPG